MTYAAPEAWQELVRASSKLDRYRAVRRTQRVALIGVMVVALLGRAVAAFAGLPSVLAFAFFPGLLMILLLQRPSGTVFERKLIRLIVVLALVVAASVVVNQSNPTAGLLLWASLATPFLMILGIRRAWPTASTAPALLAVFSVLLGVQALVIIAQAVFLGQTSDSARGLLANQGAGHHVLGLIGVGAAVYVGTMIAEQASLRRRVWPYGLVLLGLLMAWLTRTDQALLAFVLESSSWALSTASPRARCGSAMQSLL